MKKKYKKYEDTINIGGEQFNPDDAQLPDGFAESVEVFSANDVDNITVVPRKRRRTSFSVAQAVVLIICAVTFAFSSVMLVKWKLTTDKADSFYDDLQNIFNSKSAVSLPNALYKSSSAVCLSDMLSGEGDNIVFISPEKLTHFEEMLTKLERIRAIAARAKDVYGWVKVSGTASIDYPIMRTSNNDYYLSKLPDGTTSSSGSIFADYRTESYILNNKHIVLYGHNMADGSMFRDLRYFYWPSKVLSKYKNTEVEIITDDGI
ncbi:MAG TPA: class B sortase, partial [Bacillota bacterium]|nr:class B sortase [Bacillota bacterium]